jgi:hypothetical protein
MVTELGASMSNHERGFGSAAAGYLQRQAVKRKVAEAAMDAIRVIAEGCPDPVAVAQRILKLESDLMELGAGKPERVSYEIDSRRRI